MSLTKNPEAGSRCGAEPGQQPEVPGSFGAVDVRGRDGDVRAVEQALEVFDQEVWNPSDRDQLIRRDRDDNRQRILLVSGLAEDAQIVSRLKPLQRGVDLLPGGGGLYAVNDLW